MMEDLRDKIIIPESVSYEADSGPSEGKLQRTEEWNEQRNGMWTGSFFSDIVGCSRAGSKIPYYDDNKVKALSDSVLKSIFRKYMERKRKFNIKTRSSMSAKYGQNVEPFQIKRANKKLEEKGLKIVECGFQKCEHLPNTGSSYDGRLINIETGEFIGPVEIKSTDSDNGLFDRISSEPHEKHIDFWQLQGQLMNEKSDSVLYIVSTPPPDSAVYVYDFDDLLFDQWCEETEQLMFEVKRSEDHISFLEKRILFCEDIVQKMINENKTIFEAFNEVHEEFTIKQNKVLQNEKEQAIEQTFDDVIEVIKEKIEDEPNKTETRPDSESDPEPKPEGPDPDEYEF